MTAAQVFFDSGQLGLQIISRARRVYKSVPSGTHDERGWLETLAKENSPSQASRRERRPTSGHIDQRQEPPPPRPRARRLCRPTQGWASFISYDEVRQASECARVRPGRQSPKVHEPSRRAPRSEVLRRPNRPQTLRRNVDAAGPRPRLHQDMINGAGRSWTRRDPPSSAAAGTKK